MKHMDYFIYISVLSFQREFNATMLWHWDILVDYAIKTIYNKCILNTILE